MATATLSPLLVRLVAPGKDFDGKIIDLPDPRTDWVRVFNEMHDGFGIKAEPVTEQLCPAAGKAGAA